MTEKGFTLQQKKFNDLKNSFKNCDKIIRNTNFIQFIHEDIIQENPQPPKINDPDIAMTWRLQPYLYKTKLHTRYDCQNKFQIDI